MAQQMDMFHLLHCLVDIVYPFTLSYNITHHHLLLLCILDPAQPSCHTPDFAHCERLRRTLEIALQCFSSALFQVKSHKACNVCLIMHSCALVTAHTSRHGHVRPVHNGFYSAHSY